MTAEEFKDRYRVRECNRCCASCRHGRDLCDDGVCQCVHPKLDGDSLYTSLDSVCDAWEDR